MRGCNVSDAGAVLELALDMLEKRRLAAAALWDDRTRARFEAKYVLPVLPLAARARDALRHLAEVLRQAEQDCGEER